MGVPSIHKEEAKRVLLRDIRVAIITVSTSRHRKLITEGIRDDPSGDIAEKIVRENGYNVGYRCIIPDKNKSIMEALDRAIDKECSIIIFIGGTGITKTDVTPDTLDKIFEKKIMGFGELFRFLSYKEIGSSAFLSRATAGIHKNHIIFAIPGSPNAVKRALEKLILPEMEHMVYLIQKEL